MRPNTVWPAWSCPWGTCPLQGCQCLQWLCDKEPGCPGEWYRHMQYPCPGVALVWASPLPGHSQVPVAGREGGKPSWREQTFAMGSHPPQGPHFGWSGGNGLLLWGDGAILMSAAGLVMLLWVFQLALGLWGFAEHQTWFMNQTLSLREEERGEFALIDHD